MAKPHPPADSDAATRQAQRERGASTAQADQDGASSGQPINMRRALAGLNLMKGMSQKQALVQAGYSPVTAANPSRNGLTAERCIEEAKRLDPGADPASLLAAARRVMAERLRTLDPSAQPPHQIARIVEVAEKFYGGSDLDRARGEARSFADRIVLLRETMAEIERRGLLAGPENGDSRDLDIVATPVDGEPDGE